jgi:tRNA-splicing ligase RtcB
MELLKIDNNIYEIPKSGNMLVPGRIYADKNILDTVKNDESLKQIKNVATLPGIYKYSLAMPDIHEGYGFPIGGVAAVDKKSGYISPGGVGYDINCGVRLLRTGLFFNEIKDKISDIAATIFTSVPSGVGSKNKIFSLSKKELKKVILKGAKWAVEKGFGTEEDIEYTEDNGAIENEGFEFISERALERGKNQLGTLGSGNHFIELQIVDKIFNREKASVFGIEKNMVMILFHTGSRGFGYQICDDFLRLIRNNQHKFNYNPPDKQLIACPFESELGYKYFNAMNAAANYAWANRQVIKGIIEESLIKTLKLSYNYLKLNQIYDVCHNIAKIEGKYIIHRKGATRALPPKSENIPEKYRNIGQPVIVPGDMGTGSYLLVATDKSEQTFASSCHGAGRTLSRKKASKKFNANSVVEELEKKGIIIFAKSKRTIVEEVPDAYKDIDNVVNVVAQCGILEKVARFKPIAVIKG